MIALELYPRFSLYRGIYKLSQYGTKGIHIRTGMNWRYMNDGVNGMKEALFIMLIEWLVVLLIVYYAEKVQSSGSGRNPLIFLNKLWKKNQRQRRNTSVLMDMPDVIQEVNYSSFYLFILFAFQHRIVQAGAYFDGLPICVLSKQCFNFAFTLINFVICNLQFIFSSNLCNTELDQM